MSRSMFLHCLCLLVFTVYTGILQAQQYHALILSKLTNLPHAGDSIVKQQVDYVDPGMAGTNIIWDFRSVHPVNAYYNLRYHIISPDSMQISGIEHGTVYNFMINGDSLIHTGYENNTTIMKYTIPEVRLKFPFHYGNIISSDFSGEGEYCHLTVLHVTGRTTISADATGTLYAPLGLTFKNVLRIKSLREYFQTGLDSVTMNLESYAWYVPENRYPVFETIKTETKKTGWQATEHKVASFFYPPSDQVHLLADTNNWTKQYNIDEIFDTERLFTNYKLIPNPVQSQLRIEYVLISDAAISFKVYDSNGLIKLTIPEVVKHSGSYTEIIEMDGFAPGIYIINVIINELVKSMKVIKI